MGNCNHILERWNKQMVKWSNGWLFSWMIVQVDDWMIDQSWKHEMIINKKFFSLNLSILLVVRSWTYKRTTKRIRSLMQVKRTFNRFYKSYWTPGTVGLDRSICTKRWNSNVQIAEVQLNESTRTYCNLEGESLAIEKIADHRSNEDVDAL